MGNQTELVDANEEVKSKMDSSLLFNNLGKDLSMNCLVRCSIFDHAALSSLNRSFRSLIKSGMLYRVRRIENTLDYLVYYSCNPLEWEVFELKGGHFLRLPEMPSDECFKCSDKESLAVGPELLVFGRATTSPIIYKYHISRNIWSTGMSMNTPRFLFASASHNEYAFIAGGCDQHGNVLRSAELYNSERENFDILPDMNKARKMCSGFFMDGKFYVVGGIDEGMKQFTCGEEFDPMTKTWNLIKDMFPRQDDGVADAITAPPLVAVVNNTLYAAHCGARVVKRYKKEQNTWVIIGEIPERVAAIYGWGLAFRACKDALIFVGGISATMIGVYSCIPRENASLQWNLLACNQSGDFVYNCAVMGC